MSLANDPQSAIHDAVRAIEPHLIEIRRDIHAHPELAFEEFRTSGIVAAELARLGIPHQTGIGRTGVVGLIEGGRPGPVLAIRADMDALPIHEQTGLPFSSTIDGKMHACGHDVHTVTLLGVADVLRQMAPQLAGTIKLVFQPAEETLGGMAAMIEDGVMEGPHVDMALGFHNRPTMPVGKFSYVRGIGSASSDHIKIVVSGKSGHAAHPNNAVDPVVAAAHLVTQIQTVVSREVDPLHPAVVTIGAINGGYAHNIIPDHVTLLGTVRTLDEKARAIAESAIQRLCDGMLGGMRVQCELTYTRGVPSIRNDDRVLDVSVAAMRQQFGADKVVESRAGLGGEDFALMTELVPGCRVLIGAGQPGRSDHVHNSDYQPDEACIGLGVEALSRAALELLG